MLGNIDVEHRGFLSKLLKRISLTASNTEVPFVWNLHFSLYNLLQNRFGGCVVILDTVLTEADIDKATALVPYMASTKEIVDTSTQNTFLAS